MKLPNSISPAFIEWLDRGGHKIELKKNAMIVKKQFSDGVKRSVIPFERHEIKEFSFCYVHYVEYFCLFWGFH